MHMSFDYLIKKPVVGSESNTDFLNYLETWNSKTFLHSTLPTILHCQNKQLKTSVHTLVCTFGFTISQHA